MAVNLSIPEVETRDHRLGAIIAFNGSAQALVRQSKNKGVREHTRGFSQCSDCAQGCAETLTYLVKDSAVVMHSPLGCCNPAIYTMGAEVATKMRGLEPYKVHAVSTNMSVKDTVYGGVQKLRESVLESYRRFNPKVIFIQSSCAAGIIGDDIESVVDELESELPAPLVPVYCEGFKSKTWASGFDAVFHGTLRKIVRTPQKKDPDLVNIFNFQGCDTFTPLFERLKLKANLVVPLATVEGLASMGEAACSTHICETLGTYVAEALEQKFGVPQIKAPSPYGINWTDEWIRALCKETDRIELGELLIRAEHERIAPRLEALRKRLAGKTAYLFAGDSYAHNLANIVKDLGMNVSGITTLHHDQVTDSPDEKFNTLNELTQSIGDVEHLCVANKQPFIMVKILRNLHPDILITRHNNIDVVGAKLGIPSIRANDANVISCYDGVLNIGQRIVDALDAKKFYETVAEHVKLPYSSWWLNEEPDPYYFDRDREVTL